MTVQKREDNWKTRYSRDRLKGKRSETAHGAILRRMRYRFSLEIPLSHPPKMTEREIGRRIPKLSRKDSNLSFGLWTYKQTAQKGVLIIPPSNLGEDVKSQGVRQHGKPVCHTVYGTLEQTLSRS